MKPHYPTLRARTPAKLNLRLKITGRRPDGYHELVSVMVPVGLFDELTFSVTPSGLQLRCDGLALPDQEENLVNRAARAFFRRSGIRSGLDATLTKAIPVAAGLGGGSSDAACTLATLNRMWGQPLGARELAEEALLLGADVPFFLRHGPCVAGGVGEILQPLKSWPGFWYVIVTPPVSVSTPQVFAAFDRLTVRSAVPRIELTKQEYNATMTILGEHSPSLRSLLENDLEAVTAARFPSIPRIKQALMAEGAEGALMSGSGPSVFGLFLAERKAIHARKALASRRVGQVHLAPDLRGEDWGVVKR